MQFIVNGKINPKPFVPPWLTPVLQGIQKQAKEDVLVILSQESQRSKMCYVFENRKSKLTAVLRKVNKTFQLAISVMQHSPMEMGLCSSSLRALTCEQADENHVQVLVSAIVELVCVKNQFWHGQFEKTRVSSVPDPAYRFYGGKIIHMLLLNEGADILVESGMRYLIAACHDVDTRQLNQYLVMQHDEKFSIVSETDFKTYFTMA